MTNDNLSFPIGDAQTPAEFDFDAIKSHEQDIADLPGRLRGAVESADAALNAPKINGLTGIFRC